MNPELLERFLAKKAKKLGISVEELKAQGGTSPVSSQPSESNSAPTAAEPHYVQQTIQQQLEREQVYEPLKPQPEKINVPWQTSDTAFNSSMSPQIVDKRENKFALIGYPLGHSLSDVIHGAGFKSLGIDATYEILETPPEDLVDRIKFLKSNGYKGFNVTIPLKLPVSMFVNEFDKYANLSRAVNTVYIDSDKTLKAYNTDVIGFRRSIPSDIDLRGKSVAILGTGGAAHAACVALSECGVKEITFFTRNIPNSIDIMNYFRRIFPSIGFNVFQIENIRSLSEYSMLVNTTPIGMLGKAADMMPVEISALETLKNDALVFDVIYNPRKTKLIKAAEKRGLKTITGLDMLIWQAVAAEEIWLENRTPDFKDMKIAALESF